MSLRALSLGAILAGCLAPGAAMAVPAARLVMVQEAALTGCVDEADLWRMVVARLSYDPFSAGSGSTLLVTVARQNAALIGSVEVIDAHGISRGTREIAIESGRCDELLEALSLSLSIAIDPEAALAARAPDAELAPAVATEPPAPTPKTLETPPRSALEPTQPRREAPARGSAEPRHSDREPQRPVTNSAVYALDAEAISMLGVAPVTAFGGALTARRKSHRWALGIGARALSGSGGVGADGDLRTTVAAGQLEGCFQPGILEYCALAIVGATWARALDVELPHTDSAILVALGARVGLAAPLSQTWSLLVHAELVGVPAPVQAQVDERPVWTAPPLAGGVGLGLRRRFP
jgi:hypothetical protein